MGQPVQNSGANVRIGGGSRQFLEGSESALTRRSSADGRTRRIPLEADLCASSPETRKAVIRAPPLSHQQVMKLT
jgi:hypothetical protein